MLIAAELGSLFDIEDSMAPAKDIHLPYLNKVISPPRSYERDKLEQRQIFYVCTSEHLRHAIEYLSKSTVISFDVEGVNLSRSGKLSICQIYDGSIVYVFDVLRMGKALFECGNGLKEILENPKIVKVMWDCRRDSDALLHQFGVTLDGVVDLQVMEVLIRYRFVKAIPKYVMSLEKTIEEYSIACPVGYVEMRQFAMDLYSPKRGGNPKIWEKRPIDDVLLLYTVEDIVCIYRIFTERFVRLLSIHTALVASKPRLVEFRDSACVVKNQGSFCKVDFDVQKYSQYEDCMRGCPLPHLWEEMIFKRYALF